MKLKHIPYKIDPTRRKSHYYETLWKKVALELLAKHDKDLKGQTLLDFGCGRGETMNFAREMSMVPTGTDVDPRCVELSSKFGDAKILDTERVLEQFGENSFDVVASFHVLEHVPRPMETLTTLRKIARKWVIIAVPNLSRPRDMIRHRKWDGCVNEGHIQSWDHCHFRNMAERFCGLELVEWGFDATVIPPWSNWIERFIGMKPAIALETKIFKKLWPYAGVSVIAIMKPNEEAENDDS